MTTYEIAVVGLGGFGSAAAFWAAQRLGTGVIGFEQFELGHRNGASEDRSRIIRYSYHRPDYVRLARAAYETWGRVAAAAEERLIIKTGGLDLFPPNGAIPLEDYERSMAAVGVDYDLFESHTAMARWPQFALPPGCRVLWQRDAGVVLADLANRAHRRLAVESGATLLERTEVRAIALSGDGYEIRTEGRRFRARRLILTCDAWTNQALSWFDLGLNLAVTREEVAYYSAARPGLDNLPIWIWMDDPGFYGFPDIAGAGIKLGQDVGGAEVDPGQRGFEPDPAYQGRLAAFVDRLLPGARGAVLDARTCLYTLTPDREFVIDLLPGHAGAALALGSGHGFKFASVIGRTLVELTCDGEASVDISGWSIDRPVLTMSDPPRHYLV